jgi:AraC-like DNA-binding protein
MNTENKKYIVDMGWQVLLRDLGLSAEDVLRHAHLPLDLLNRKSPTLTAEEYFRLWGGLAYMMRHETTFALKLGQAISVEAFSPPIFACFCSANMTIAFKRLGQYKPLVGPFRLDVKHNHQGIVVTLSGISDNHPVPHSLIATELVFMTHLVRIATREHIIPQAVTMTVPPPESHAYADFFGVDIVHGTSNSLHFSSQDAQRPFLTINDTMWSIFEPELISRMNSLDKEAGFRERVRACLMKILASGEYGMADVAKHLSISTRTLQRRLQEEGTTFQKELDELREELARNYLSKSDYSSGQIAFLLGYEDPNSFFRAFRAWTGKTPEGIRTAVQ